MVGTMEPDIKGAMYGVSRHSAAQEFDFTAGTYPLRDRIQRASHRIDSDFFIYREVSHGYDGILVIYYESGILSCGDLLDPERHHAEGFFRSHFTNSIDVINPATGKPFTSGVSWVSSSPQTVNQSVDKQDMLVHTVDNNFSIGINASKEGSGGNLSYTHSESIQTWKSSTFSLKDWGVEERTDALTNRGEWLWRQQLPYDVVELDPAAFGGQRERRPMNFINKFGIAVFGLGPRGENFIDYRKWKNNGWWPRAFSSDDIFENARPIEVADLSRNTMQYSTSIALRFDTEMIEKGSLPVSFRVNNNAVYQLPHGLWGDRGFELHTRHADMISTYDIDLPEVIMKGMG